MNYSTDNTRIIDRIKVPAPYELVNKYPINDENEKDIVLIAISSDRGLCASFNSQILKHLYKEIEHYQSEGKKRKK